MNELHKFIEMQKAALSSLHLHVQSKEQPFKVPKTGELSILGEAWEYRCHGSGVLFRLKRSGMVVDVHNNIDAPEAFDRWRLRTYFGSLGRRGVRVLERAVGARGISIDSALSLLLEQWKASGDILERDGYYYLSRPTERSPVDC